MKLKKKIIKKIKFILSGFTLIELLVVVAILGLMASVILVAMNTTRVTGRNTLRYSNNVQVIKALEFYYDKYGYYPAGELESPGVLPPYTNIDANYIGNFIPELRSEGFLASTVRDPIYPATDYWTIYLHDDYPAIQSLNCTSSLLPASTSTWPRVVIVTNYESGQVPPGAQKCKSGIYYCSCISK